MYVERIKREYGVECEVGAPRVNYRESIQKKTKFDYQHKKQSGGQGQYGRVMGFIEPAESVMAAPEFENRMIGNVRTQPPPTPTPEPKTSLNRTSQRRSSASEYPHPPPTPIVPPTHPISYYQRVRGRELLYSPTPKRWSGAAPR